MFILMSLASCKHLKWISCTKWILNCRTYIRQFTTEQLFSWILIPLENSIMIHGSKGYAESPNRKTGIGSVLFRMVVLSLFEASYWLKNSKNTRIINASWSFYHYILKAIFVVAHGWNVKGKRSFDIIWAMFI